MKKTTFLLLCSLFCMIMSFSNAFAGPTAKSVVPGDSNCDGEVNVMDVITSINYILGNNPQPFCFENADVNGDGSVNAIDAIGTINIILGSGFTCGVSTITDVDGNIYNTVLIGVQCWMKENLKTTAYDNGTSIPNITDADEWSNLTSGAFVWNDNDIAWKDIYGALYNYYTVNNPNGLCPTGWHVPSRAEWLQLVNYVESQGFPNTNVTNGAGSALKSCRQVDSPLGGDCNTTEHPRWAPHNTFYGFDEFGFSGLGGGFRNFIGQWDPIGFNGIYWSSTESTTSDAWVRFLHSNYGYISGDGFGYPKVSGFSVRCLKDNVRTEVN